MRTGGKLVWVIAWAVLGLTTGCGPEVPEEELGQVEFRVPDLPGAEEPFALPPEVIAAKERAAGEQAGEHEGEHNH